MPESITLMPTEVGVQEATGQDGNPVRILVITVDNRQYLLPMDVGNAGRIGLALQGKGIVQPSPNAIPNLRPGGRAA